MKNRRIWLILITLLIVGFLVGTAGFVWRHSQPLPDIQKVETYFSQEITRLEELSSQIDPSELSIKSPTLPDLGKITGISPVVPSLGKLQELVGRVKEVEDEFSGSEVLSAGISFTQSGSTSHISVVYDKSLNIWSPDVYGSTDSGSNISFCYSGLRQLVKYEKQVSSQPGHVTSIRLIFPTSLMEKEKE